MKADDEQMTAESADVLAQGGGVLSSHVKIEPLIDHWPAWPHLLCPVQAALNLAFRYLPTARSFVSAPSVHIAALQDPAMFGGPFLDLPIEAVPVVKRYIANVEAKRAPALAFAQLFRQFEGHLQSANGLCLDEMREQAPAALRGRIEIAYNRQNAPNIRVLEEMFEDDDLGLADAQGVLVHTQADTERSFFLSTPRICVPNSLYLGSPLRSAPVRALCTARRIPTDLHALAEQVGSSAESLASFMTVATPSSVASPPSGVRIRYAGHACLVIETPTTTIVTDPTFANDRLSGVDHMTVADLPEHIDALFISHGHQDHLMPEALMQLRDRVDVVLAPPCNRGELADPSIRRMLAHLGYENVVTLEALESYSLPDGQITALPFSGEHCDLDVHSKQCALIELGGRRIGLFVDTDAVDLDVYRRLAPRLQGCDAIFVGMECFGAPLSWLYGPLIPRSIPKRVDSSRRMSGANCARAAALTNLLKPRRAFVYAMGQELWLRSLMGLNYTTDSVQMKESSAFVDYCRSQGIEAARLHNSAEIQL